MRTKLAMGLFGAALATGMVSEARAQAAVAPVMVEASAARGALTAPEARRLMQVAGRHAENGNLLRARREYELLSERMLADGVLPSEVLWRLAAVHFAEGRPLRAATTLDRLATLGESHGQVAVQVAALLEAGRIYERERMKAESVARLTRALGLMNTPGLNEETRVALMKRIRG